MSEREASHRPARTVGLVGYGALGQFMLAQMQGSPEVRRRLAPAFVYNRSAARLASAGLPDDSLLTGDDPGKAVSAWLTAGGQVDLIAEVSHPEHIARHGERFLEAADLFVASVSALADPDTASRMLAAARDNASGHGLYVPTGAAWGLQDIRRMSRAGTLEGLAVSMRFHADALRLTPPLAGKLAAWRDDDTDSEPLLLFDGVVADLAPLAPNNVNTMAALALAGDALGPARTRARLVAHKGEHTHVVRIDVAGPDGFSVTTERHNPAKPGAVTGAQTYHSFLVSLLDAGGRGSGLHFC